MSAFPKHPAYKDSGVEWLGEVPEHWEIMPFLAAFDMSGEKNGKKIVGNMLAISGYRGVEEKKYESDSQKRSEEQLADYRVVRRGQLAVNTMWLNYAGLGVSELEGHMSPAYRAYYIQPQLQGRFAHHLLRSFSYVQGYTGLMQGIRPNSLQIKSEDFKRIPVLVPPRAEQDRIVAFLDEKTAQIDVLIVKKQRQIELLEEQKAILINRAVTRGLQPNPDLQDSGITWIGPIPKHWTVGRVRHLFHNLDNRRVPLSAVDRGRMTKRLYDYYGASGVIDQVDDYLYDEDLLLIAEDGANLVMRNLPLAIIARGKYWVNNHAHILKPKSGVLEYWFHALECADYSTSITGAAQPKLTKDALADISLPHPPQAEQEEIVRELTSLCDNIKKASQLFESQIQTLQTLRSTLIAHAVTGKIKVSFSL